MPRRRAETTLHARWSKRERDLMFHHPGPKPDGHLLYGALCGAKWRPDWENMRVGGIHDKSFVEELEARGYDITTLRFSVKLRHDSPTSLCRYRDRAREWFRASPTAAPDTNEAKGQAASSDTGHGGSGNESG